MACWDRWISYEKWKKIKGKKTNSLFHMQAVTDLDIFHVRQPVITADFLGLRSSKDLMFKIIYIFLKNFKKEPLKNVF